MNTWDAVVIGGGASGLSAALMLRRSPGLTDQLPQIPGLAERWGQSVLHCPYCHGWEVRDRRLAVLGTSSMALYQVQLIRQLSDDVTLFTDGADYVDQMAKTSHPNIWAVGNVVEQHANVPMSIGVGSFVGASVNAALVAEDFDNAEKEQRSNYERRIDEDPQ